MGSLCDPALCDPPWESTFRMNNEPRLDPDSNRKQPDETPVEWLPEKSVNPSHKTVFLVLGGMLLAGGLFVALGIAGVVWTYQQQQARQAQEAARLVEMRQQELLVQQRMAGEQSAARKKVEAERILAQEQQRMENERREEDEARLRTERLAEMKEQQRIANLEAEKSVRQEKSDRGLNYIQDALFKQINTNDPDGFLAPGPERDSNLSWRVHLLPDLGLQELYNQFHLDEAWDSEHNRTLFSKMPPYFGAESETGLTRVRSFLRLDGEEGNHTRVGDILDGLEQTALLFYVGESKSILWTQPDDVPAITPVTFERLGISADEALRYTRCGNHLVWAAKNLPPDVLRAIGTPAWGEVLDDQLLAGGLLDEISSARLSGLSPSTDLQSFQQRDPEQESKDAAAKMNQIALALWQRDKEVNPKPEPAQNSQLSWRVHLLPSLGQEKLYKQFQLNEAWNSEANLKLIPAMPDIYRMGTITGRTRFLLSLPADCPRGLGELPSAGAITDSPGLTTVLYVAAPHRGTVWTKPDTLESFKGSPQQALGWSDRTSVIATTLEGITIEIPGNLHPTKLAALFSTRGGEVFDLAEALKFPDQKLRRAPMVKPAEPITDLITLPKLNTEVAALRPAVPPKDALRFRRLNYAVFACADATGESPSHKITRAGVRSQLSWRVHLLPFLEEQTLYDRFHLEEPWDSEHNLSLLEFMPEVFRTSSDSPTATSLRVLSGNGSLFAANKQWLRAEDGLPNTIMLLLAGKPAEQPWTKPDIDLEVSSLDFEKLFGDAQEIHALMGDGLVLPFSRDTPAVIFRALATANGHELIDAATVRRWLIHKRGEALFPPIRNTQWESEQMKTIVLASMNFESAYLNYSPLQRDEPVDEISLRSSMLSWRVHLLPLLNHASLYNQFRLEEPWDSPHNIQLLPCMPDCFRAADDSEESHTTRIVRIMGRGTAFPQVGRAVKSRDIRDGSHQTIHFIQAPAADAVPWTRPDDILIDLDASNADDALNRLLATTNLKTATFDGAIRRLSPTVNAETFKALLTPSGSEILKTADMFIKD